MEILKVIVLSVLLLQEISTISGERSADVVTDTLIPGQENERNNFAISSTSNDPNKQNEFTQGSTTTGTYNFHASQQIFYLSGPFAFKRSAALSGIDGNLADNSLNNKQLSSDYAVTHGMGAHKLHLRKLPWNRARKICVEEGGHLAVIRTDSEAKIVTQMLAQEGVDDAWLGLHDKFEEGDWVSVLDEPIAETGWARWSKKFANNPDNYNGKQHCARLVRVGDGMDDDVCEIAKPFVCKISVS